MKKNPLLILAFVVLVCSCSKKDAETSPTAPPVDEPKDPVRIEKVINRYISSFDQHLIERTYTYEYDDSGRVTKCTTVGEFYDEYTYTDGKLNTLTVGPEGVVTVNSSFNYAKYSADGDTILMDFSKPSAGGTGTDTTQISYIYKNGCITEDWQYYHSYDPDYIGLQKEFFIYNTDGNLTGIYSSSNYVPRFAEQIVYEWDDKVNPKYGQPNINFLLLFSGLPVQSCSMHNPIKYEDALGNMHNVKMTYNDDGYPLTVQMDNNDYITTEIFYNR